MNFWSFPSWIRTLFYSEMDFKGILSSLRPGDALAHWDGPYPSFFEYARDVPAGPLPWHSGSVFEHMVGCMDAVSGDPLAVWLAFVHDAGKLTTPKNLWPHHYGHELRGETLALLWARQLGLDDFYAEAGGLAAGWHMRAGRYPILRPGKKLNLLNRFAPVGMGRSFWKMVDADSKTDLSKHIMKDWRTISEAKEKGLSEQKQIQLLVAGGRQTRKSIPKSS